MATKYFKDVVSLERQNLVALLKIISNCTVLLYNLNFT